MHDPMGVYYKTLIIQTSPYQKPVCIRMATILDGNDTLAYHASLLQGPTFAVSGPLFFTEEAEGSII